MENKINCRNFNHGKQNPSVAFCPTCGEKFQSQPSTKKTCDANTHNSDRKNRNLFCSNCGKNLNK